MPAIEVSGPRAGWGGGAPLARYEGGGFASKLLQGYASTSGKDDDPLKTLTAIRTARAPKVTAGPPQGTGPAGSYQTGDFAPGGALYDANAWGGEAPDNSQSYQRGGKVTPTPTIRNNLPRHRSDDWDESEGRELPSRPIEWYEKGDVNDWTGGGGRLLRGDFPPPPEPPFGDRPDTKMRYADGGAVFTPRTESFQSGGQSGTGQQPFGYDPTAYVTTATQWAMDQKDKQDKTYQWALDQFNKNQGASDRVTNAALKQGDIWGDASAAGLSRYESMYPDAMKEQLDFARQYASPENLALYRGQAMAGVGQAFDAQAKAAADQLQSYGLDPTAVGSRLDATVRTQRAAAEAGAGTQSDINAKLVGQQLLGQAISTGMQGAQVAQGQAGVSQAARNQAVNTGLATTSTGSATMGTPTQWAALANTELKEWPKAELDAMHASNEQGALWNDINKTNLQAQKQAEDQSGGAGALIGAGLGTIAKFAPLLMAAEGAAIPDDGMPTQAMQTGNVVPPTAEVPDIPGKDKVPALVGKGEGILPKDVMDWIGEKGFQALIQKVRAERQKQTVAEGQPADPRAAEMAEQAGPQFASEGAAA